MNDIPGPAFLDGLTEQIDNPRNLLPHEWRRRLRSLSGQTKFKIKFYGKLHESYKELIVGTDFAPSLVFAVDPSTGEEILLFDGCKHGYNAMFCDTFSEDQIQNRPVETFYVDKDGRDVFEIVISTYNGNNDELSDEAGEDGLIELINGSKIELEKAMRDCFDTFQLFATNENGRTIAIVEEELA